MTGVIICCPACGLRFLSLPHPQPSLPVLRAPMPALPSCCSTVGRICSKCLEGLQEQPSAPTAASSPRLGGLAKAPEHGWLCAIQLQAA